MLKTFFRFPLLNADGGAAGGGAAGGAGAAGDGGAGAAGAAGGAGAAPVVQDWTSSLPEDMKLFVNNKGFKDPAMVLDSYRNFEKLMGAPKERLLTLPENLEDPASILPIFDRLGRPAKAEEYGIKFTDELGGEEYAGFMKNTVHELGLTRKQAETLATKLQEKFNGDVASEVQKMTTENQNQVKNLKTKWGSAHDQNLNIAKRAAVAFGIDDTKIDALQSVLGYDGTMEFMHTIGSKIGEHDFKGSGNGGNPNVLTPGQAQARISELTTDKAFRARLLARDGAATAEWNRLHEQATPAQQ